MLACFQIDKNIFVWFCGWLLFGNSIYFMNLVHMFHFLASVQIYIQIVPLCNYNDNIRKQVYMAFKHGLFNK